MRIHRLEVEGFGPFRDKQTVDFEAFAGEGIFLIGGKTGAGKSSILDAICFALYGAVPRYEDGEKRLRSDHSALDEPTRVAIEFSNAGRRWRVERVPSYERRKKTGTGTTLSPASATLWEDVDGEWIGRAARPVDVGHELDPILGLNLQQFLQVILLAQGRFARFLLAKNDERQALLRTLFDSHRFGGYEDEFEKRRRDASDRLALEGRTVTVQLETAERLAASIALGSDEQDAAEDSVEARLARVDRARLRARAAAEQSEAAEQAARAAHAQADAAHSERVAQRETQRRRDRSRAVLAELEGRTDEMAAVRAALRDARDAEALRAPIDSAARALVAVQAADAAVAAALAEWEGRGETDAGADALDARADALLGDIATFRTALAAEHELSALRDRSRAAAERIARLDDDIAARERRRGELPALIDAASARAIAAASVAGGRDAAEARRAQAHARVTGARETVDAAAAATLAERSAADAGKALTQASATLDELRDRRFRDHAGELAEHLVDGEPCAVCGAREHPRPAVRHDEPVTPELLADAEAAKISAIDVDRRASIALREAEQRLAEATARAAGLSVSEAEVEFEEATKALRAAEAAIEERAEADAEHTRLSAEQAAATEELSALAVQRTEAATEHARLDQAVRASEELVGSARGDHASVQARITETERTVACARTLAAARRALESAAVAAEKAADDLAMRLAEAHVEDAAAAQAALRSAAERDRMDERLRAYDAEIASQRQTLMELELAALPEEPIETHETESALAAALDAWRTAVAAHTEAQRLAQQLAEASDVAHAAHAAIEALDEDVRVIERLANAVAGRAPNTMKMNLETFVLAAQLEEIVAAANGRLAEMSEGRFLLQHTDARAARGAASGLGIEVMDRHTGQARPVQSLSGGETFLASLALALGLAEVVTSRAGGITLDTLFIDEGFGSLDPDTLDIAMRTLDELRQGGRTVGVISHVEAMKDAIPARLLVESSPQGPSVIRQDVAAF